jgi:hypothetical protein
VERLGLVSDLVCCVEMGWDGSKTLIGILVYGNTMLFHKTLMELVVMCMVDSYLIGI